ncbi:MAG TPA: substrate-binding domain-containing protein [Chitinophagales bacterium]|nr:substrate-binding domain-containing protein [Chitinophagales bacterium]HMU68755.1 substrate-binding domain-containing protein [Chitinophagales bacterium]HMX03873.1 substrate-binding domain-containing protein [Chitinophagales bacterium]HMZ90083.1 substrate-binding domain-containing protein [Chitinophagales bacterium]HNA57180.1 substrate-binding domain-containing protein [Chitinophagales bacterium]
MKPSKLFLLIAISAITFSSCSGDKKENTEEAGKLEGKISISGAFALYPMAVQWGEEFKKLHPDVQFDIQGGGAGKGMTDVLSGTVDLGMVSRDVNDEEKSKGAFDFSVCKDAVLPTINAENPYRELLYQKGISNQQFIDVFITGKITTWGQLLGNGAKEKIDLYTRSDAAGAAESWAKFLGGKKQEDLKGVGVMGDPGLAQAVVQSKFSLGFNNVSFAYDNVTKINNPGIAVAPIDVNSNGTLDADENFYGNIDQVNEAILNGKYPSPPARPLLFVSKGNPTDPVVIAFLQYVLTEGQKGVSDAGFVALPADVIKQQIEKLPSAKQ